MKISKGPMLESFAERYDVPIDEVVAWVNKYVNAPDDGLPWQVEATPRERLESIRECIEAMLKNSLARTA